MVRLLAMAVLVFATLPAAAATYQNIPIDSVANDSLATYYHEIQPGGDLLLGGVPFHIGTTGLNVFQSQANGYGAGKPTSAHLDILDIEISTARYAHVLLAGTSVHLSYAGATMGSVTLGYGDGSRQRFDLVVGDSVRDWVAVDGVVVSTSSPMVQTVWQGTSEAYWGYREA